MRRMDELKLDSKSLQLYLVTDRRWSEGESFYSDVEEALKGGVSFLQIREKNISRDEFVKLANRLNELAAKYGVPFVINDDISLLNEVDCHGVHIGQNDGGIKAAKESIGIDKILGVSVQTVEQAIYAQECGADYLGVGAVFPTGSKKDAAEVSHEMLKSICESVDIPVVAIGGINSSNIKELKGSGIHGVAVISAILAQKDKKVASIELNEMLDFVNEEELVI